MATEQAAAMIIPEASSGLAVESPSPTKPVHTIVLDSSPLLLNSPPLSTLLACGHALNTTPSVIAEIRDQDARSRIETFYIPFITLRSPKPESIKFVREFALRTGDTAVLSNTDIDVLALAYDLECERNGGDWRLRRIPGQKRMNGRPPVKERTGSEEPEKPVSNEQMPHGLEDITHLANAPNLQLKDTWQNLPPPSAESVASKNGVSVSQESESSQEARQDSSESDSEGWITPSNIKRHQAMHDATSTSTKSELKIMQVATMTGDFAMQNVLLQMNLNLLSVTTCKRIAHLKRTILRCHGCFAVTKEMDKQFCSRCGQPTLTRVSCTTNDKGEVRLHLKANMQWNNKGNVFSVPKPVSGNSNQKWQGPKHGGGQSGWGSDLILAEDQKEYVRAMTSGRKGKDKDLMDDDYLPSILTGDRDRMSRRTKVGAGRAVNSRKTR